MWAASRTLLVPSGEVSGEYYRRSAGEHGEKKGTMGKEEKATTGMKN